VPARITPLGAAYLILSLLPLGVAAAADPITAWRSPVVESSTAFGLLAFALVLLQFALVPRLWPRAMPVATDALMLFHREMGLVAVAFAVAHPLLLLPHGTRPLAWIPFNGPPGTTWGALALWALVLLVMLAVFRRRLPVAYEAWHRAHLLASVAVAGATLAHILAMDRYAGAPPVRAVLVGYVLAFAALLVRYRVLRPTRLWRHPWEVVASRKETGRTQLIRVRPLDHAGLNFQPGQFAWLNTGPTPFGIEQHPISIASSAEPSSDGALEFAIKRLGDWSSKVVPSLKAGDRLWVDGAYGTFTPDLGSAHRLVLIAGGIGIAPMRSILLTLRDRADTRPVHLFYCAGDRSRAAFADEIDNLQPRVRLTTTYVFEQPPDRGWTGERGVLTADILARHLPERTALDTYFVCGPGPMMDAVEAMLGSLGVPRGSIHTERFDMV
jgi:predicted ferric reductase